MRSEIGSIFHVLGNHRCVSLSVWCSFQVPNWEKRSAWYEGVLRPCCTLHYWISFDAPKSARLYRNHSLHKQGELPPSSTDWLWATGTDRGAGESALFDFGSEGGVLLTNGLEVIQNPLQVCHSFVPVFGLDLGTRTETVGTLQLLIKNHSAPSHGPKATETFIERAAVHHVSLQLLSTLRLWPDGSFSGETC